MKVSTCCALKYSNEEFIKNIAVHQTINAN